MKIFSSKIIAVKLSPKIGQYTWWVIKNDYMNEVHEILLKFQVYGVRNASLSPRTVAERVLFASDRRITYAPARVSKKLKDKVAEIDLIVKNIKEMEMPNKVGYELYLDVLKAHLKALAKSCFSDCPAEIEPTQAGIEDSFNELAEKCKQR